MSVSIGVDRAGSTLNGWLFSTPTYLGASTVDPRGNAVFTIPGGMPAGAHRLAITDAQNNLIGWGNIQIATAVSTDGGAPTDSGSTNEKSTISTLAATGTDLPIGIVAAGALLLLAGSALLVARSRSRRA